MRLFCVHLCLCLSAPLPTVIATNDWQDVNAYLAIDYEHFTESRLSFRILPKNSLGAVGNGTVQSAYKSQSISCSGRGSGLLHRDLLLSPSVLNLMLNSFGNTLPHSNNNSVRYLYFADDKRLGDGGQTTIWMAEWLPATREINFELVNTEKALSRPKIPFFMVHLCHRLQSRLSVQPAVAPELTSLLPSSPALLLSVICSIISCLLLCLMLRYFARLTHQVRRFQRCLTFSYQSGFGFDNCSRNCSFSNSAGRVRYNGSISPMPNRYCSIEARMEHEKRMRASYY